MLYLNVNAVGVVGLALGAVNSNDVLKAYLVEQRAALALQHAQLARRVNLPPRALHPLASRIGTRCGNRALEERPADGSLLLLARLAKFIEHRDNRRHPLADCGDRRRATILSVEDPITPDLGEGEIGREAEGGRVRVQVATV